MMKKIIFCLIVFSLFLFVVGCNEEVGVEPEVIGDMEPKETVQEEAGERKSGEELVQSVLEEESEEKIVSAEGTASEDQAQEIVEEETGLVAHWKFDDNAKDSANNYDGTINGGASFIEGKVGKAIIFDGVDDYVELPEEALDKIGSLNQGTIAFWFRYESLLDKQTIMPIFYIGVNEKDPDYMFIIEMGHFKDTFSEDGFPQRGAHPGPTNDPDPTNKKLYVTWVKDNKDPFLCYDSNLNLEENRWHHFAAVVGPDGNTGYLNGVEMDNRHYNFGSASNPYFLDDIQNKKKLMIGHGRSVHTFSPDFVYFKGALDDFRVYEKTLSGEEIKRLAE